MQCTILLLQDKTDSAKKGHKKEHNGQIGTAPLPPIQDNKMKDEVNEYKKKSTEQERKLVSNKAGIQVRLTLSSAGTNSADGKLMIFFSYFCQKMGSDSHFKLS